MKTVTVKRIADLSEKLPRTAVDGIRVFVDGVNVMGDDKNYFSAFRNADYESTDGYAAMSLLLALQKHGVIDLKCDDDVAEHYITKQL
jgi:hypothetical protein